MQYGVGSLHFADAPGSRGKLAAQCEGDEEGLGGSSDLTR